MKRKTKRRMKTANRILILMGSVALAFIVTMIVTFWRFGSVPDTLIQCVLGAGGIESAALAAIKITKVRHYKKEESE